MDDVVDHECGTLLLECCAKTRARNVKELQAIVSMLGEELEPDDPRDEQPHG